MSIIEIKNLSFGYEKNKLVVDSINVSFGEGKIIALIGKNGSGKSTFLDCLLGINSFDGEILINGENITELNDREYSKLVSFIPQSAQINIDYSIKDFISFGRNPYKQLGLSLNESDWKIVHENAEKCGIVELLNKDINKVSGGERQLAFIARALTQETPIIVMDEPTAALDFGNQQRLFKLMKNLKQLGKTIIFTTHNPNHLVNLDCDIFAISDRRINPIDKLDKETLKTIYEEEFDEEGNAFLFKY